MVKTTLQNKEPIAYQCLHNDLVNNKVSHSYLFVGEYSPLKIDAAFLLAQSIIEGNNDYACEECTTCKRVKDLSYTDFRFIDGYDHSIKKEEIEEMMQAFSTTALEKANKKVYIIANINNSNSKVLNMILKFIEEPINNTYGIFICDNESALLQTIVSRCQKIRFKTRDFSFIQNDYIEQGFSDDDAYLLSCINHRFDSNLIDNQEIFNKAKDCAFDLIDNLNNKEFIPVLISSEFPSSLSKKEYVKDSVYYFIEIMLQMIEDAISNNSIENDTYNLKIGALNKNHPEELLKIFVDAKNKCRIAINRQLLLDKIAYEIIKMR